jgi:hypothetical protein
VVLVLDEQFDPHRAIRRRIAAHWCGVEVGSDYPLRIENIAKLGSPV